MDSDYSIKARRIETVKQAFLDGEASYDCTIKKLYTSRLYYSLKIAKGVVDSWGPEIRRPFREEKMPRINDPGF